MTETTLTQYSLGTYDGEPYGERFIDSEEALAHLERQRKRLQEQKVPEDHWPILMEREITTTYGSWRHRSE